MAATTVRARPPLWLAAGAVAAGWTAINSIASWFLLWIVNGAIHEDFRMTYVAAKAGASYGWSTIYDESVLRSLSAGFPPGATNIDALYTYLNPPLLAWMIAPLTVFPEPVAYASWSVVSLAAL